jgi:hypothetical protein
MTFVPASPPKMLVFGTHSNCLNLRCHEPHSKTKRLLTVFSDFATAAIRCEAEFRRTDSNLPFAA